MSRKKRLMKKAQKKGKRVKHAGVDERLKKIAQIKDPEEDPFKMDNERIVERWRPLWRSPKNKLTIRENKQIKKKQNRWKKGMLDKLH